MAFVAMSPDVLITIKLLVGTENRRFKLPLRELGAHTLPDKLRTLLSVPPTKNVIFERYSDSAAKYVTLDSSNPSVYKQLYRAAKAKLKLRIKATIIDPSMPNEELQHSEPATPDHLTSHRYIPPMNPDPLKVAVPQPTVASLPEATPVSPIPSVQATENRLPSHIIARLPPIVPKSEITDAAKKDTCGEAPVPNAFPDQERVYPSFATKQPIALRAVDQSFHVSGATFTVCCNKCNVNIPDVHYHCSICQDGDYDLCHECVTNNVHCRVPGHFLIKRNIENGRVISSTTETVPKKAVKIETEKEVPGAFNTNTKEEQLPETLEMMIRTCNSCVNAFEESNFVTCTVCEDYDLCIPCHVDLKHGHHPNHPFAPVSPESTLNETALLLCAPGRNMRHFAICDGCDKCIFGVRHKCLNCPDWDLCTTCFKSAPHIHPGHRFVPIYEALANPIKPSFSKPHVHRGINCDGPLCKDKVNVNWITGDRYKCAVCHDTDFCAKCEALPTNRHNRTHPLIKFRTPVRNVSVTTLGEKENGEVMYTMGDRSQTCVANDRSALTSSKSTETTPSAPSVNAATQVQTVAEMRPSEPVKEEPKVEKAASAQLEASFVRDTITDGTEMEAGHQFQQIWTLTNPGPNVWPAGCSVRFVGGDNNMLNVDPDHPSSVDDIEKAIESNTIARVVEVGEEVDFVVTIKAPRRCGKAISYWRLKSADGTPFGHRLWCDIDVIEKEVKAEPTPELVVKEEPKFEEIKEEEHTSQMIFPKLDKESPVSSTHEGLSSDQSAALPSTIPAEEQLLIIDEVEPLELDVYETSDDGFMTDEEYEILDMDSHDEEAINGKK